MHVYVCIYIYINIYTYIHIHICVYIYIYMYRVASGVSEALVYLHSRKPCIVHSDVKPTNILVEEGLRILEEGYARHTWKLCLRSLSNPTHRCILEVCALRREADEYHRRGPKVGLPLFTLPRALTLGPAHWDPAHAGSKRQAGSLNKYNV